jgi:predicted CoA-binding protein
MEREMKKFIEKIKKLIYTTTPQSMFISKIYTYALIGASTNPDKYGNIILNDFVSNGYHTIPLNPHAEEINGIKAYKNLTDISEPVDVVIFTVQPETVVQLLPLVKEKGIKKIWLQP